MSSFTTLFFFFFFLVTFTYTYAASDPFSSLPKPKAFLFSISRNETTRQYYTDFMFGNPKSSPITVGALIDLGAPSVWFDCSSYVSSTYKRASCGSNRCKISKGDVCLSCNSTPKPGCSNNTCGVYAYNPFTTYLTAQELGEDTMVGISATDGLYTKLTYDVPKIQFSCADSSIVQGLPSDYTKGLVGLGRTRVSFPSQISTSFSLLKKFSLCIPATNGTGAIIIGGGPYIMPPNGDLSFSLVSTPLVVNPVSTAPVYSQGDSSDEYFITVKDIKVSGKSLAFDKSLLSFDKNGVGGTKISTIQPYTVLHASIYKRLVKDFITAASVNDIKRVKSVAPFGACFDSRTTQEVFSGPSVPKIDLVLEGLNVVLRLHGSNSMVKVKENVICLAFIDGGVEPRTSIVLGGYQLEERLLEFDLTTSSLGFTDSLLVYKSTCTQSRLF